MESWDIVEMAPEKTKKSEAAPKLCEGNAPTNSI
jgi:hypothetical protein